MSTYERKQLTTQLRKHVTVNDETECWEWGGPVDRYGYSKAWSPRTQQWRPGHRWSFEYLTGHKLTPEETIDHLCQFKLCINPDHLEIVSRSENSKRANEQRWRGASFERGDKAIDET